ncbi:MAG: divalent-cation tolerance protein CutA [Beijerinckiaceae bacterium]
MTAQACLVITTTADEASARAMAASLLQQKLAACVQIFPVESHYVWDGTVQQDKEFALHIKTRTPLYAELEKAILAIHSYETPEIICLPVTEGHSAYLEWIGKITAR